MSESSCPFYAATLIQFSEIPVFAPTTGDPVCGLITHKSSPCILALAEDPVDWNACPYNPRINGSYLDTGIPLPAAVRDVRESIAEFGAAFEALGDDRPIRFPPGEPVFDTPESVAAKCETARRQVADRFRTLRKAEPAAISGLSEVTRDEG